MQTFVNGVDTQTYGIDYVATYAMSYGKFGHVDYSLSMNYNDTRVLKVHAPPSNVSPNVILLDQGAVSGLEDATPKWRGAFNAYWSKGPWSLNFRENFYGSSFTYGQDAVSGKYTQLLVRAAWLSDFEGGYQFSHGVKFSVGRPTRSTSTRTRIPTAIDTHSCRRTPRPTRASIRRAPTAATTAASTTAS